MSSTTQQTPDREGQRQVMPAAPVAPSPHGPTPGNGSRPAMPPVQQQGLQAAPMLNGGIYQRQGPRLQGGVPQTPYPTMLQPQGMGQPPATQAPGNGVPMAPPQMAQGGPRPPVPAPPTPMLPLQGGPPVPSVPGALIQPRGVLAPAAPTPAVSNAPAAPVAPMIPNQRQGTEIEGGNIILYRGPDFFVRTTNRRGRLPNPLRKPSGHTTALPKVMPQQEIRVASSETRMMPQIEPVNPVKKSKFPIPPWAEILVVLVGLLASLVAHAFNMFNFPRYDLDEGTYMSNAWAILNGQISATPYGYGHPPLAWMQIAGWVQLTGGFFTFGDAINTGRVFMLFLVVADTLLVYLIVRRLGGSRSTGLLAMVVFSLSPLSITYQRQVFLDNVGTFWLLLSLYLIVSGNSRLSRLVLAGLTFGAAFLCKETFVLFLPAMIYAVWLHTTPFQRKFALVAFIYAAIAFSSTYVLLAFMKGEFFPYAWHLPGDSHPHLSFLDTYGSQIKRTQSEGSLGASWQSWFAGDPFLVICSVVTIGFNAIAGWWNRRQLLLAILAFSYWLLLIRGGVVLAFYYIPLIPLAAINTAVAVNTIMNWIGKFLRFDLVRAVLVLGAIATIIPYDMANASIDFTQHPTSTQTAAMRWIRQNVPHNAFIVINGYLYTDLTLPGGEGVGDGATYPFAEVYHTVATDPEVKVKILHNDWNRIDYVIADSGMLQDIQNFGGGYNIIKDAIDHSVLRATFSADDHTYQIVLSIYQVQHARPQPVVMSPSSAPSGASTGQAVIWNERWRG